MNNPKVGAHKELKYKEVEVQRRSEMDGLHCTYTIHIIMNLEGFDYYGF
jgi:hypothetical protein